MRRTAPRPLSAALGALRAGLAPATTLAAAQELWESAVGSAVAAEAKPASERGGVLTVACRSAVWAQELSLMGPELLERLNGALVGARGPQPVRELRFVVQGH